MGGWCDIRVGTVVQVNELVKRARLAKVHAYIISYLRSQMPTLWGKDSKQRELIENLNLVFYELHKKHHLPVGDFPEMGRMKEMLRHCDFKKFQKLNQRLINSMDEVLGRDIPKLMRQLGHEHFVSGLTEEKVDDVTMPVPAGYDAAGGAGAGAVGAGAGAGAGAGGGVDLGGIDSSGMTREQARLQLVEFYTRFNPAKLHAVDAILVEYDGRYSKLFQALEARYGKLPPPAPQPAATAPAAAAPAPPPPIPARPTRKPVTSTPPVDAAADVAGGGGGAPPAKVVDNPFDDVDSAEDNNPFASDDEEEAEPVEPWALEGDRETYNAIFQSLNPEGGLLSGKAAKPTLVDSGLKRKQLKQLWVLSDIDQDGCVWRSGVAVAVAPGCGVVLTLARARWADSWIWKSSVWRCTSLLWAKLGKSCQTSCQSASSPSRSASLLLLLPAECPCLGVVCAWLPCVWERVRESMFVALGWLKINSSGSAQPAAMHMCTHSHTTSFWGTRCPGHSVNCDDLGRRSWLSRALRFFFRCLLSTAMLSCFICVLLATCSLSVTASMVPGASTPLRGFTRRPGGTVSGSSPCWGVIVTPMPMPM